MGSTPMLYGGPEAADACIRRRDERVDAYARAEAHHRKD